MSTTPRSSALVQRSAPELGQRCRTHLKSAIDSWRVDETSIKVRGIWMYRYRAVDSAGSTLEFLHNLIRDAAATEPVFQKELGAAYTVAPRVITVNKHAAYPKVFTHPKRGGVLPHPCDLRQVKYLNHLIEQDHRFIKRPAKPGMGCFSLERAWRTLWGYEAVHMIRKGQMRSVEKGSIKTHITFISSRFEVVAQAEQAGHSVSLATLQDFLQHNQ